MHGADFDRQVLPGRTQQTGVERSIVVLGIPGADMDGSAGKQFFVVVEFKFANGGASPGRGMSVTGSSRRRSAAASA